MSSFWQTVIGALIGGVLTIVGGFGAVWWQTRHADDTARRIRREERREEALIALNGKVTEVYGRLASIRPMAETSPLTSQYHAAKRALDELFQLWNEQWGAAISDQHIVISFRALGLRAERLLPGSPEMPYTESEPAAKAAHFQSDLADLLDLTRALRDEVHKTIEKFRSG